MISVTKTFDIEHIPDNEANYFDLLASVINNIDSASQLHIIKNPGNYLCRISTSKKIILPLIEELNNFNKKMGIFVDFSKSMKAGSLSFKILLT